MTRLLLLALSAFLITLGTVASAQERSEHTLLDQLRVITGDGSVLENAAVLLQGDTIVAVGASAGMDIPADTTRINLAGKTLLPALIDAHAHLGYEGTSSWGAQNYTRENLLAQLNRYAWYGFGAVFSAGSDPDALALEIQRQQAAGEIGGARFVFAAGMAPPGQGPNNQFLVEALAVEQQTGNTILRGLASEEQARDAVRAVAELQIPFIKLWVDDRNGTQVKLSPAIYRATIAEARQHGIAVVVHQQYADDMPDLIAAGVSGFLHGRLEEGFTPEIALAAKQNDVFIVPNLGLAELRREAIGADPFLAHTLPAETALRMSASAHSAWQNRHAIHNWSKPCKAVSPCC
jgi:imidazolonepropionase-like amidohydrolase